MARIQAQSISQEKFLLVAVNLPHKAFVVAHTEFRADSATARFA